MPIELRRRLDHRPALDGVRGVAVLVIVVHHLIPLIEGQGATVPQRT